MGRKKDSGLVWRPIEYAMFAFALVLIIFLIWMLREIRQEEQANVDAPIVAQEDDSDISRIVEQGIVAEEHLDETYDTWEAQSNAVVDSAADDLGGAINESSY